MNTKKDDPGKSSGPSGSGTGTRPHATLDLKATEVGAKPAKEGANPPKSESTPQGAGVTPTKDTADKKPEPKLAQPASSATKPRGTASDTKSSPAEKPRPWTTRTVPTFASLATHLAAGIAGGVIALLAIDLLGPQLGLTGASNDSEATKVLQQRLAALEESAKKSDNASRQLSSAEAQLSKLDKSVKSIGQRQGKISADLKSLDAALNAETPAQEIQARVGKLENQLTTLSAAAEGESGSGSLPQLAAITGKIAELESDIGNQLGALREKVAKSDTQQADRELAALKANEAQLSGRLDVLKAQSDRDSAELQAVQQRLATLKSELISRLESYAKPAAIADAVAPITTTVAALNDKVDGVIKSEEDRKANAERIHLAIELGDLKRAVDRGDSYAPELTEARKLAGDKIDLAPLAPFQDQGVPTLAQLKDDFRSTAFGIINAARTPADGSVVERLLAEAQSFVRVRKISHSPDDTSVEAVVGRMEKSLDDGNLQDVLDEANALPPTAAAAAKDFLTKVKARVAVDRALTELDDQLKASLGPAGAASSGSTQ